ncbi:inactive histone-lysine N-methyltransferase SUVR2 [Hirschfeldia incana]|nr:inactive histone-lysine N-methyltransferase SUVR2 [Hirschfeldia incana]
MAPNAHIKKAMTAMKALGIEEAQIKPVLKNLLTLYDKNWELIAEDNYRALADAFFDSQETQATEEKKGKEKKADQAEASAAEVDRGKRKVHEFLSFHTLSQSEEDDEDALDEPEHPLKRLRRRGEASSVSAPNSPSFKETTTHDQEMAPVSLPFHPLPTENDPDGGALVIPKGEPVTDMPFTSTHPDSLGNGNSSAAMSVTEETNGRVEERHGSTAATVDGATNGMVASTPEGSSTLELASSAAGEVKINLSLAPATGGSSLHAPSADELRRAMEDVCLRQYKILDPNFSVSRFLNDIARTYLELAKKAQNPANQSPENMPSLTTNVDALKKPAAAMTSTDEGSNDLATKATVHVLNKSAETTANTSTVRNDHVRDDENSGVGESTGLVADPECQISADEFRMISSVSDITFGEETVEISWVNEFNTKVPPPFGYIHQSLVYLDAEVKFSLGNIKDGQCCSSCCGDCLSPSVACSCATALGGCTYTKDGLLQRDFLEECISEARDTQKQVVQYCKECPLEKAKNEETLEPCKGHRHRKVIRECWSNCGCTKKCGNRVVQHGIHTKLQVFFTSGGLSGRGWGLRTLEKLPKGAFVCELAGEILTISELVQRRSSEKLTSPVILDAKWGAEEVLAVNRALCLDGTHYGNISRFINHRCADANLIEIPVHVENMDSHYYHLGLFTTRDIEAMEELTWDYGVEFNDHVYPTRPFHCRCGSEFCRNVKRSSKSKKSKKK